MVTGWILNLQEETAKLQNCKLNILLISAVNSKCSLHNQ